METGADCTRAVLARDLAAIDDLLKAAFGTGDEAALVRALREEGSVEAEVVTLHRGEVVAHACVSRMREPQGWLCLAPVAVAPAFQGRRLGSALVRDLVRDHCETGGRYMVVLGEVAFYERAGFSRARAARLVTDYPLEHMMLAGPGADAPRKTLVYPEAFEGL